MCVCFSVCVCVFVFECVRMCTPVQWLQLSIIILITVKKTDEGVATSI